MRAISENILLHENVIITSTNSNLLFKYINKSKSHSSGIAPLKMTQGNLALNSIDKANTLNDFFADVGTIDDGVLPNLHVDNMVQEELLSSVYFECAAVERFCSRF